jgi:hypothetical protein
MGLELAHLEHPHYLRNKFRAPPSKTSVQSFRYSGLQRHHAIYQNQFFTSYSKDLFYYREKLRKKYSQIKYGWRAGVASELFDGIN